MPILTVEIDHNIEDIVYLKTDEDQKERIVTALNIRETGIMYELACGVQSSWHYQVEISTVKDYTKS